MHNEIVPISGGAGISLSCHSPSYDDNTINLKHFGFLFIFFPAFKFRAFFLRKNPVSCAGGVCVFDSIPDLALGADHVFALVYLHTCNHLYSVPVIL